MRLNEEESILEEWVYQCFEDGDLSKLVGDEVVDKRKLDRVIQLSRSWSFPRKPFHSRRSLPTSARRFTRVLTVERGCELQPLLEDGLIVLLAHRCRSGLHCNIAIDESSNSGAVVMAVD
ncbi:hypothetical protein LguiA_013461 [Lonicera macranthoides]